MTVNKPRLVCPACHVYMRAVGDFVWRCEGCKGVFITGLALASNHVLYSSETEEK